MLNFNELYDLYAHDVYRFAYWLCGDYLEAEDITSETFVRVWVRFDSIRTETLRAYLFAIARNIFLKKLRKRKGQAPLNETFPDRNPEPEELVDSRIELQRVQNILATFSEKDRTAFILRVQHELPYKEISRVLGISLTAAKVKVHRVRKKLLATRSGKEDD